MVTARDNLAVHGPGSKSVVLGFGALPDRVRTGTYGQTTVTLADDDTKGVSISKTRLTVTEAAGDGNTDTYTVVLTSKPVGGNVTVMLGNTDSFVATVSPAALTFTATDWNMPQTVTVTAVDDDIVNTVARTTIIHTVSGADYALVAAANVTVTLTDDDMAGVTIAPTEVTVSEAAGHGNTAIYTVVLTSEPVGGNVIVIPESDDLSTATVSPAALTFTATDWDMPQTVTVTGISDNTVNTVARTTTIMHNVSGADYATVTAANVTVTLTDDDMVMTVSQGITDANFVLYPNPGNARINLKTEHSVAFDREWALLDLSGKKMLTGTLPKGKQRLTMRTKDVVAGTYLFCIFSPDKEWTLLRVSIEH